MKILIVEDDENIIIPLIEDLSEQNFVLEVATDGQSAWDLLDVFTYDLILLDIVLPKINGIDLCKRLRSSGLTTPLLMLTARDTVSDRVQGLDAGADDYLIKPYALPELSARIRALLRRGETQLPPILTWGDLSLDPSACQVTHRHHRLNLSPTEYRLLEFFLRHPQRVFSRSQILDHLWSSEQFPDESTIKAHIRSLRQKLIAAEASPDIIETVYGLGYRLKEKPKN
jgi:DNA-binding response OmpR family regulator